MKLTDYNFPSFSLHPELCRTMAEAYLDSGNWAATKQRVLSGNLLQMRSESSAKRMEMELRKRLKALTQNQIKLLAEVPSDSRVSLAWLAACKHSVFVRDFAVTILRGKLNNQDSLLRPSDFEGFFDSQALEHTKAASLKQSTKAKIQGIVKKMLREGGLLDVAGDKTLICRPVIPADVRDAVMADDPRWFAVFLVPDDEIYAMRS